MFFSAFTGKDGSSVSGRSTDVRGMLQTAFARGGGRINTAAAAKELGVSQRTVQRWIKGQMKPKPANLKSIQDKAKKTASTKQGRRQAIQDAQNSRLARRGARLTIKGRQGVDGTSASGQGYKRDRSATLQLTPDQMQDIIWAYAENGDQGMQAAFEKLYSDNYGAGDWAIDHINDITFDDI